jgi:uncharacterized protein (TIGR03790 family)
LKLSELSEFNMKNLLKKISALVVCVPLLAQAGGDEVVVLYNSRVPESKQVAEHYAALRQVPGKQIFGFALTTNEIISRADFTDFLQKPLVKKLEDAGLWKFAKVGIAATNGVKAHKETHVVESRIRYAVLCYGMPLKIDSAAVNESVSEKKFPPDLRANAAAVDSELAWLPFAKESVPLTGPLANPFYLCTNRAAVGCTNGILLVARLDGPSALIASNLVDKALAAEHNGLWGRAYFDTRGLAPKDPYFLGDEWIGTAALIARQQGFTILVDANAETFRNWQPLSHIAIYAGWYDGEANGPFALPRVEFMPGAFAYHLHSASASSLRTTNKFWCGPLLAKGATCTLGCVYEPYLPFTPNIAFFVQQFGAGSTFGEAAWTSQVSLSWMNTVIGDPLYRPVNQPLPQLHAQLAREKNPLIEWSFERLVNLDLVHGLRAPQMANFLESIPDTKASAVLTERLAELYDAQGKPSSAIDAWQRAMKLNPSREQHIRLHRVLAEKLAAAGRPDEQAENWRQYLAEFPDDPDAFATRERLNLLEQQLAARKK